MRGEGAAPLRAAPKSDGSAAHSPGREDGSFRPFPACRLTLPVKIERSAGVRIKTAFDAPAVPWYDTLYFGGGAAVKQRGLKKIHIGLRTVKTALAIIVSMLIADQFGGTGDKLIFAMLGAMSVVEPTFKESVTACLGQIIGVCTGALISVLLIALPISGLTAVGIGVIGIIVLYNGFRMKTSPSLPCFIMVLICTSSDVDPMLYALGRIWDTAIGLGVGMFINMLVFPYDNSRQIRSTMESLDRDLLAFLEDLFDGDRSLPDPEVLTQKHARLQEQMSIFANQRLLLHLRRQKQELERLRICDRKAKELVAHLAVLGHMEAPGRLSPENRKRLAACGAEIRDARQLDSVMEVDVVTNFHVGQILTLRRELLENLRRR